MAFPPQHLPVSSSLLKLQRQDTKNLHRRTSTSSTLDDDDDCYGDGYGVETSYFQRLSSSLTGHSDHPPPHPTSSPPPPHTIQSAPSSDDDATIHSTVLGSGLSLYELTEKLTKNPYLWVEFRQLLKDESVVTDVGVFVYLNRFVAEHLDEIMMEVELENEEKKRKEKEKGGAFERFKRASVDMLSGRWTGNAATPGGPVGHVAQKRRGTMSLFGSTVEDEDNPDDAAWAKMNASESWIGNTEVGRGSITLYNDENDAMARMHASENWEGEGKSRRSSLIDIGGMFSGYLSTAKTSNAAEEGDGMKMREEKAMAQLLISDDEMMEAKAGESKIDDKSTTLMEANTNTATISTKSSSEQQQQQQQQQFGSSFGMLFNGGSFQSSDNNAENPTPLSPEPCPPEGPPPTTTPVPSNKRRTTMDLLSNKLSSLLGDEVIPAPAPPPPPPPSKKDMFRSESSLPRYPSLHARRAQSDGFAPPQHTRTLSGLSKTGGRLPLQGRVRSASMRPRMSGDEFEMCKERSDESDGEEDGVDTKSLTNKKEMTNGSRADNSSMSNNVDTVAKARRQSWSVTTMNTNDTSNVNNPTNNNDTENFPVININGDELPLPAALSRQSSKSKVTSRRRSSMSSISSLKSTESKSKSRRRSSLSSQTINDTSQSTPSRRPSLSRTERRRRRSSLKLMENMDSDEEEEEENKKETTRRHRRPSVTGNDKTKSEDKSKPRRRRFSITSRRPSLTTTPTTETTDQKRPAARLYPTDNESDNTDAGYSIHSHSTAPRRRSSRLASMSKIVSQRNMNDEEEDTDNNETEIRLRSHRRLETVMANESEFSSDNEGKNRRQLCKQPCKSFRYQDRRIGSDSESSASLMERRLKSHRDKMSSHSSLNRINALRHSSRRGMTSDSEVLREEVIPSKREGVESEGERISARRREGMTALRSLSRLSSRRSSDSDALEASSTIRSSRLVTRRKSDGGEDALDASLRLSMRSSSSRLDDESVGDVVAKANGFRSLRAMGRERSLRATSDSEVGGLQSRRRLTSGGNESEGRMVMSNRRLTTSAGEKETMLARDRSMRGSMRSISRDRSMRGTSDTEIGGLASQRSIRRLSSTRARDSDDNDAGNALMKDQTALHRSSRRSISRDRSLRATSDSEIAGLASTRSLRNATTTALSSTTARDRRTARSSFTEGQDTTATARLRNNTSVRSRLTRAADGDLNGGISQAMRELKTGTGTRQRRVSEDSKRGMAAAAAATVAGR